MLKTRFLSRIMIVAAVALMATTAFAVRPVAADHSEMNCTEPSGGWNNNSGDGTDNLMVIGLTSDQRLICFSEDAPDDAEDIGQISGLDGDRSLIGLDYRPANNTLYGVGNAGGIYTVNSDDASATKVAQLSVALNGTVFGVDVNPAADALRIISNTGQNLRFSFSAGTTTVDVPLTYPPATTPATGVTGAAYTNNDSDPNTATTLYDIDTRMNQVAIQAPANSGQLSPTGMLTVDTSIRVGFDIYSTVRDGSTVDVRGLASLVVDGRVGMYRITLFTGKATFQGAFTTNNRVIDIAIPLNQL